MMKGRERKGRERYEKMNKRGLIAREGEGRRTKTQPDESVKYRLLFLLLNHTLPS